MNSAICLPPSARKNRETAVTGPRISVRRRGEHHESGGGKNHDGSPELSPMSSGSVRRCARGSLSRVPLPAGDRRPPRRWGRGRPPPRGRRTSGGTEPLAEFRAAVAGGVGPAFSATRGPGIARAGRHGSGVKGAPDEARPPRCDQDTAAGGRPRPRVRRALPTRGPFVGPAQSSEYRHHPRFR